MTVMLDLWDSPAKPQERPQAAEVAQQPRRRIHALYDAAQTTSEFANWWARTDSYSADNGNSREVRETLVQRSRYETDNNPYTDGMTQTHANYLVGTGPKLRMQTGSKIFNQLIEDEWKRWSKAIQLRRKLWTMAHAKVQDGEGFGVIRTNLRMMHPVKIDLVLYETEQIQTPYVPYGVVGYIDGIRFDEYGNPLWYDVLQQHPGSDWSFNNSYLQPESVPARYVLHWYKMRRPGQHRGVPEFRSSLTTGAASRRFREAVVAAAETAADVSIYLKTMLAPNEEADLVAPFSQVEFTKRMMIAGPMGWEAQQIKGEHPNAAYREFHRQQINEQGRPKSMPVNVAMADSSDHNFASGKLDHLSWFAELNVEREDANDTVLDPLFAEWWQEASQVFGYQWSQPYLPPHSWDWPTLPVADEKARAQARDIDLANGSCSLTRAYKDMGYDFEDELPQMARDYGLSEDEMRQVLVSKILGGSQQMDPPQPEEVDDGEEN